MQFEREKRNLFVNKVLSWYNKQILFSYCTRVGSRIRVGPKELTLKISGNVELLLDDDILIHSPLHISLTSYFCPYSKLEIGKGTHIGPYTAIRVAKHIKIGERCLIARWVRIFDHNGHAIDPGLRWERKKTPIDEIRPVSIGDNVWVGENVFIQAGVSIGSGSIIAANSVVTTDVPENVIFGGNPARIKRRLEPKTVLSMK